MKSLAAGDYSLKNYLNEIENFIIPRYQRNYDWDKSNIYDLINDLYENSDYYLGNLLINENSIGECEVIDGQQRLISVFLILMAIKNYFGLDIDDIILNKDKKIKLIIKRRTDAVGQSLIDAIDKNHVNYNQTKYTEYKRYNDIINILNKEDYDKDKLLKNLLDAKIVEIRFKNREDLAHDMFVNLNTKGKPLEVIDVLKSYFFKYLAASDDADDIKEEWFLMLDKIGDKNLDKYTCIFTCLELNKKKKKTPRESLKDILKSIDSTNARKKFEKFSDFKNEHCLGSVYAAVINHDLTKLDTVLNHEATISIQSLDMIWKFFKLGNYTQFDILMTAILSYENKKNINGKYTVISNFVQLILYNFIIQSIQGASPSQYSNTFD